MKKEPEDRIRPGGVALALALLVTGTTIGFGLRTFSVPTAPADEHQEPHLSVRQYRPAGATASPRPSRAREHRSEVVTLSDKQWSEVLARPQDFALRLADLRGTPDAATRLAMVDRNARLFGWEDETAEHVQVALQNFDERLRALELEKAEASHATSPNPGQFRLEVNYGPLSGDMQILQEELHEELIAILGPKNHRQFSVVSNLDGMLAHRSAETIDQIQVYLGSGTMIIQQETLIGGHPYWRSTRSLEGEELAARAAQAITPAINWDQLLQQWQDEQPQEQDGQPEQDEQLQEHDGQPPHQEPIIITD